MPCTLRTLRAGLVRLFAPGVVALASCVAAPRLPPEAGNAASIAEASRDTRTLARKVSIVGPRGRLDVRAREALLARLASQGSATLLQRQLAAMTVFGDMDLFAGNDARLLVDGPATFDAMFRAIDSARRSVLVESYIVEDAAITRQLAERLIRKRAQGVPVALMYDHLGSFGTDDAYFDALRAAGVAVCAFNPIAPTARARPAQPASQRDHRKIVAVDGTVAFTGGINVSGAYSSGSFSRGRADTPEGGAGWRDTHVQVRGPVAAELDRLVRATWRDQGCEGDLASTPAVPVSLAGANVIRVVATQPDDDYPRMYAQLMAAFDTAQRSIHLTMAYFAPGDDMVDALCDAARRGVDVQLLLPSQSDFRPVLHAGRARYDALLAAGAHIHEFQGAVLHAKTAVVDGVWSTVGSTNLDFRSFTGNNEINVVVLGEDFGDAMEQMFRRDLARAEPITLERWRQRPWTERVLQGAARLFERWW